MTSATNTPYYEYALSNIKKIQKLPNFPNLSSKEIYHEIRIKCIPRVEDINQTKNWKDIWRNLKFKYIPIKDRNVVFKFIHEILPTNKKLRQMKTKDSDRKVVSSNCNFCQNEDSNIHKFYECFKIQRAIKMLKKLIEHITSMRFQSIAKLLYLELPNINIKIKNSINIIICNFITCTWFNRENLEHMEEKIISKIWKEKEFLLVVLKHKASKVLCKKYIELDIEKLKERLYGL